MFSSGALNIKTETLTEQRRKQDKRFFGHTSNIYGFLEVYFCGFR